MARWICLLTLLFQCMLCLCFAEKPIWREVEDESALFSSVKDSEDDFQLGNDAPATKRKMIKGIKSSPLHSFLSCFYFQRTLGRKMLESLDIRSIKEVPHRSA